MGTPLLVQSASATGTSNTSLTITLPSVTTAGNCLVLCIGMVQYTTNPTVSGVILNPGGSAGNWASAVTAYNNTYVNTATWVDPNCAGGQTSVVVTLTGGTGASPAVAAYVMEWSGVATATPVDKTNGSENYFNSWSSGSTGTLTQSNEVAFGIAWTNSGTLSTPGSPWTELPQLNSSTWLLGVGYQVVSATTALTYSGTTNTSTYYSTCICTLKASTSVSVTLPVAQVNIAAPPPGITGPAASVVNQWAATFTQPVSFGTTTPPALESAVVALNSSTSVGIGSGTPSAGNWLFCMVAMNEQLTTSGFTVAVNDDIRSFWRPGNESTSTWAVSAGLALTRTAIWYTPNIARAPGNVYVAPNGCFGALAVLVIEVAGLGPWDTVSGINTNYAAGATSLPLALGAPSGASFALGAVGGDDTTVSQAFAPGGWTALHTVTVTDGSDHLADAVLTSAWTTTSGSISVSGTASATNLSGALIEVLLNAPSPIPAAQNPAWPYIKVEVALGAGFQTPPDQLTWTDITNRAWSWDETAGTQYQLNQVRASNVTVELDNYDAALSYDNASGPYYGTLNTGNPIRIRGAAGTLGGATFNRWYVIQKNAQEWPQEITDIHRRYAPVTATDIWSVMAAPCFTPYRGEVYQDAPYAWWPCDDQPLARGVLPTTLRNAALGNTNPLNIVLSPNGGTNQFYYTERGDSTSVQVNAGAPPSSAIYTAGAQAGWMWGDPPSSVTGFDTGNSVSAQPGSAAWQAAGQAGNTGSYGFFLSCNDASFPVLANGITIEGWFNYTFYGSGLAYETVADVESPVCQQPQCALTLMELATSSNPVAILQLDTSGHLNLITYNGATPTSHSIYATTDLRCQSWFSVTVNLTTTTWNVQVNGSATANVSGSGVSMTSAWTWLILNGDLAAHGGSSAGTGLVHGGNVAVSHVAVYPYILPNYRIIDHYWAAVTAFGLLPAPVATSVAFVNTEGAGYATNTAAPGGYCPDGTSSYSAGAFNGFSGVSLAAIVTANAPGGITSGPSAWVSGTGYAPANSSTSKGAFWVSWTGFAPSFNVYTAANVGSETEASVVYSSGESYNSGYGSGASGAGVGHISGGSGASPPTSGTAIGDTVAERIERVLLYGQVTYPGRCVDPASLPVQAATDVGGQASANNVINIARSDGGFLHVDSQGNLTYWQKSHLASQYSSPAWTLGPAASGATVIPYARPIRWTADPQRVWSFIAITPFAPDGTQLATIEPANAPGVNAAQKQYGAQPLSFPSYLQSTSEMQTQASWLFQWFGQLQIRVENLKVDAASYPAAWALVLGASVGDVVSVQNWQVGGGGTTGTFRISGIRRHLSFAGQNGQVEGSIELQVDFEPSSYWS